MLKPKVNKHPVPIALGFKLDSPAAIWKFVNWLPLILVWPFCVFMVLLDTSFSWTRLGVIVICGTVICIAYYVLRNALVAKGAAKSDLDAISKGIGRSSVATILIAVPIFGVTLISLSMFAGALGFGNTFDNGLPVIAQIAISLFLMAACAFIGWGLKGRKVYEKYVSKLNVGESQ